MHPIERIRALARASWLDPQTIAIEGADALGDAARWMDDAAAVSIARRLLAWHPYCAPLWWVCGRVLGALDPCAEARRVVRTLVEDPTGLAVDVALPEGSLALVAGSCRALDELPHSGLAGALDEASHVLIGAAALGPGGVITQAPAQEFCDAGRKAGIPVWAVAGTGCVVDPRLWNRLAALLDDAFVRPDTRIVNTSWWDGDDHGQGPPWCVVSLEDIDWVCGPDGLELPADALTRAFDSPADLLDAAGSAPF